jgi:hypothetical protein
MNPISSTLFCSEEEEGEGDGEWIGVASADCNPNKTVRIANGTNMWLFINNIAQSSLQSTDYLLSLNHKGSDDMKISKLLWLLLFLPIFAQADYQQRLSIGLGLAALNNPSETEFEVSGEYEYRSSSLIGWGGFASYIFSSPGITEIGLPQFSLHPFETDFLLNAAPILETGQYVGTHVGVRLGTRVPLPLGALTIVPTFAVDFISGGPNYIFGIGIQL